MWNRDHWTKTEYDQFVEYLLTLRDEKFYLFQVKNIPNTGKIIGIRAAMLSKLAKEIGKGNYEEFLQWIDNEYYEITKISAYLIGFVTNQRPVKEWNVVQGYLEHFLPYVDNWSTCDTLCERLKITQLYPQEMFSFVQLCLDSEQLFTKRFAYVMLLKYYIQDSYMDFIFQVCRKNHINEYYVNMAIAWLLSMCYVKYDKQTIDFLLNQLDDIGIKRMTFRKILDSFQVSKEEKEMIRMYQKIELEKTHNVGIQ